MTRWAALVLAAALLVPGATPAAAAEAVAAAAVYTVAAPLPAGAPGEVIAARPVALRLAGSTTLRSWVVQYHSRDAHGRDVAVTGTVIVPLAGWTAGGSRPWLAFGPATHGLGPGCAPSRQLAAGTEPGTDAIQAALGRNWGVAVTDYVGYTVGGRPTYLDGETLAHAVLDLARATRRIPGTGATAATSWALWGYSQGGRAVAVAAASAPRYAPRLDIRGVAAGGVPADLAAVGATMDGTHMAGFALAELIGLDAAHPHLVRLGARLTAAGRTAAARVAGMCAREVATVYGRRPLSGWTVGERSFAELAALPRVSRVLAHEAIAHMPAPRVPVLLYHGRDDEIAPIAQARALAVAWCADGGRVRFAAVDGQHATAAGTGGRRALPWLADRLAGVSEAGAC